MICYNLENKTNELKQKKIGIDFDIEIVNHAIKILDKPHQEIITMFFIDKANINDIAYKFNMGDISNLYRTIRKAIQIMSKR